LSTAHSPHPHPAAPSDIRDAFSSFQEKLASGPHFDKAALQPVEALAKGGQVGGTGGAAAASNAVEDVFDLPERFWNTPSLRWEEKEMDAVMVSAA
jgi:small subunit ribosomal protein YMR-31